MIRATMFMKQGTTHSIDEAAGRIAGTSESHVTANDNLVEVQNAFDRLCEARAALLPKNASIYGQMYSFMPRTKASKTRDKIFVGRQNLLCDIPQAALQVTLDAQGEVTNRKEFKLSFTPDARIVTGEYQDGNGYSALINTFLNQLDTRWGWYGLKNNAASGRVMQIAASGQITWLGAGDGAGIANGDKVRFLSARTVNGTRVEGTYGFKIMEGTPYLIGWQVPPGEPPAGPTQFLLGSILMKNERAFFAYDWAGITVELPRACIKKVGRPRDLFHGRRSTKR